MTLDEMKRAYVLKTLEELSGNVSEAARVLDVSRSGLQRMLKKWTGRMTVKP